VHLREPLLRRAIDPKIISVAVAAIVAWLGNRYLTFRAYRTFAVWRGRVYFGISNFLGLPVAALCLFASHYVFGRVGSTADVLVVFATLATTSSTTGGGSCLTTECAL
jgi:putative flippase GtrA